MNHLFLILIIALAFSSLLVNILPENVYTTTVTEKYTTTSTITRTETIDVPVTTHLTRTSTVKIPVTTSGIIIVQRTVLVPTTLRTSFLYTTTVTSTECRNVGGTTRCDVRTVIVRTTVGTNLVIIQRILTSCTTIYGDRECWAVYRTYTMGGAAAVRTYVPSVVQEPFMVTSETTLLSATTETLEVTTFERRTRTIEEPVTLTLENVYTSYATHLAASTSEQQAGYNFANLVSSNLAWIFILLLAILITALAIRKRHPSFKPSMAITYCINCGAQIPSNVKYCPHCGASQKE